MRNIILLLSAILFISCSEETAVTESSDDTYYPPSNRIETEATLSSNRSTILIVRSDTVSTEENGIYSAAVSNPVRKEELLVGNISSPTLSPNGNVIAFLRTSKIYFYDKTSDLMSQSSNMRSFQKIIYLNDSIIVCNDGASVFFYNLKTKSFSEIIAGFLPAVYRSDTIAYLKSLASSAHIINLKSTIEAIPLIAVDPVSIDTIFAKYPQSFGIEPYKRRYCYSLWDGERYSIYAGGPGREEDHKVAESDYPDVVMLNSNAIIYSGDDGRLYETDYLGTNSYPFWAATGGRE